MQVLVRPLVFEPTPNRKTKAMTESEIITLLETEAREINSPDFIADDPVQFPRLFSDLRDIEIAALLSATIAWGNRTMICNDCRKMLRMMDHQPYAFVMDKGYDDLPEGNIHRTFFTANLRHYLRGLNLVYTRFGSLQGFARAKGIASEEAPSWALAAHLNAAMAEANGGKSDSRCLPLNLESTALKRLNMALRWLVRDDGIVDLGVWDVLSPSQLFIPLDVHVGRISRELGLLSRRSDDRKAAVELTERLRRYRPDDPVVFDFALFGIGIRQKQTVRNLPD